MISEAKERAIAADVDQLLGYFKEHGTMPRWLVKIVIEEYADSVEELLKVDAYFRLRGFDLDRFFFPGRSKTDGDGESSEAI